MSRRTRTAPTDSWTQLSLRFTWPEQRFYEVIRLVVLFGESAEERASQTGEPVRTIYRHLQRFTAEGMAGLVAAAHPRPARRLPPAVRDLILVLHAEYPELT